MGVREIGRFLEQWQMGIRDLHRRTIPTQNRAHRQYRLFLLLQLRRSA